MIVAVGTFDGVHLGHQALVSQVCQNGQKLGLKPAIFTFPSHPLEIVAPEKAPKILTPYPQKEKLLLAAGVERVIKLDFGEQMRRMTAREFMTMLQHDYGVKAMVIGFNHRFGCNREGSYEYCKEIGDELGIKVIRGSEEVLQLSNHKLVPVSSSAIRMAISHQQIEHANAMLGREYEIAGEVDYGKGIGHTIGWPTANVRLKDARQLIPGRGVYAAWALLSDGTRYPAMVNIGIRPTIAENLEPTIEANLIDYSGNLYGSSLTLEFCRYIRRECRFESLDDLCKQLDKDQQDIVKLLRQESISE